MLKFNIKYFLKKIEVSGGINVILISKILKVLSRPLWFIEKLIIKNNIEFLYPPLFIIGTPRSGSTLIYQVLINKYKFGYISNLHDSFHWAPCLLHFFFKNVLELNSPVPYKSKYGIISGWKSPSEGGRGFWRKWFMSNNKEIEYKTKMDYNKLVILRKELATLTKIINAPLLIKNLHLTLCIEYISNIIPEAKFLYIKREPLPNALSLLIARKEFGGTYNFWFSVKPPNYQKLLKLSPEEQVVAQIYYLTQFIEKRIEKIGRNKFLIIKYEEFCKDVYQCLENIKKFIEKDGYKIKERFEVPKRFEISKLEDKKVLVGDKIYKNIIFFINKYFYNNNKFYNN
ncbi:MAG: hypothetical protein MW689_000405 [Thermodesulfobacteria bacterium]|nr:sulfotransferase [Thermodesulfobacteriota bacterium]MCU4138616.1 hypothetical protein [Thermodesulfobacteriota bacterium]